MKKLKELLYFLIPFVILTVLQITVYIPSPFVADSDTAFMGSIQYLRLLFNDNTFLRSIINSFWRPFVSSLVLISVAFSILRIKVGFSRKMFYITAFTVSVILSMGYFIFNIAFFNILGYIFTALQLGILCVFTFWLIKCAVDLFGFFRKILGKR